MKAIDPMRPTLPMLLALAAPPLCLAWGHPAPPTPLPPSYRYHPLKRKVLPCPPGSPYVRGLGRATDTALSTGWAHGRGARRVFVPDYWRYPNSARPVLVHGYWRRARPGELTDPRVAAGPR